MQFLFSLEFMTCFNGAIRSFKTLIGAKLLRIKFDKVYGFIRVYDGNRYLVLFRPEKYDAIYNRIEYLISLKNGITYAFSQNYAKIKVDSYESLPYMSHC